MKHNKQFWIIFFSFTPGFMVVVLAINYSFPGVDGFNLIKELKSAGIVGTITSVLMYFNRYTLKGEPKTRYKGQKQ